MAQVDTPTVATPAPAAACSRETHILVRERNFPSSELMQVIQYLRSEKATGTLTLNLSQGGINRIRFREEQDIRYDPSAR